MEGGSENGWGSYHVSSIRRKPSQLKSAFSLLGFDSDTLKSAPLNLQSSLRRPCITSHIVNYSVDSKLVLLVIRTLNVIILLQNFQKEAIPVISSSFDVYL